MTGQVFPGRSGDGGAVLGSAETRAPATVGGALPENAMEWVDTATDQIGFPDGDQDGMNLFREMIKPAAGYPLLAYSSPEAVQTTGTAARERRIRSGSARRDGDPHFNSDASGRGHILPGSKTI